MDTRPAFTGGSFVSGHRRLIPQIGTRFNPKGNPMVEPYRTRYDAPSQSPIISSPQTLDLSEEMWRDIQKAHSLLHITLRGAHKLALGQYPQGMHQATQDLVEPMRNQILTGVPCIDHAPNHIPVFMTTEIVLGQRKRADNEYKDADAHPYIVSINAHSIRHWELIARQAAYHTTEITNPKEILDAIESRIDQDYAITTIRERQQRDPHPNLTNAIERRGYEMRHQDTYEVMDMIRQKKAVHLLDLPMLEGTKGRRSSIKKKARIVVEPFVHLSSQFLIALLSNAENEPIQDILMSGLLFNGASPLSIRQYLPKTYRLHQKGIPLDYIVKRALPLAAQRSQGTYGNLPSSEIARHANTSVAQEPIVSIAREMPGSHKPCPLRLIFVSYGGLIKAGVAVVRLPANGSPERDVTVSINIT